jgi:ABC-type lipoprotein export system ATPase subunit
MIPLVSARDISRSYAQGDAKIHALDHASCDIFPGEQIALMGRSGSGKSTLLHLLGGLETPSSGTLLWPLLGERENLRPGKVAYVFQMQSLIPSLTVLENVSLPLLLQHDSARATGQAMKTLEQLELATLAEKLPEELSGGQAQRVAVARALASNPKLILADEPTGQLDQTTAQHLLEVLLSSVAESGAALIIATHDSLVAARFPKQWSMAHGKLERSEVNDVSSLA